MTKTTLVLVSLLLAASASAQNAKNIPLPGHAESLNRWISDNKISDEVSNALKICERHVIKPPGAPEGDYTTAYKFEPDWDSSCSALRAKAVDMANNNKAEKLKSEKAMVDRLAK